MRDKKKVILYVTLLPYIFAFFYGLYHAVMGYKFNLTGWETVYGLDAFMEAVLHLWDEIVLSVNGCAFVGLAGCVAYQIWFFLSRAKRKNKFHLPFMLLLISCIVLCIPFLYGLRAYFVGESVGIMAGELVYGIAAVQRAMFWCTIALCVVPVLPLSILYLLLYGIKKFRSRKKS